MRKTAYFASRPLDHWPEPEEMKRYFLSPPGKRWFFETGNDSADLRAEGVAGTEHLKLEEGRIDASLAMWGHPELGVLLIYSKHAGGHREVYSSKGNLSRLGDLVRSMHDTPLPAGLFIPFEQAWVAVREFIETDARRLPNGIDWVSNRELPPNTFPDP
jgi:hypothetical protein